MASMEKVIKEETDKIVEKYKERFAKEGGNFSGVLEYIFRSGISYGIYIASMALAKAPVDVTIVDQEN